MTMPLGSVSLGSLCVNTKWTRSKCNFFYFWSEPNKPRELNYKCECTLKAGIHYKNLNRFLKTRHHTLSDKGKLGIIHYATEDHTLPDFKVVPITMNLSRNV